MAARVARAVVVAALWVAWGCAAQSPLDPQEVQRLAQTPYPKDTPVGGDLDIVVERHGRMIELTNRTARSYQNVPMWLNQQYLGIAADIPIGSSRLDLSRFINEHGRPYPVGGLLSPDKTMRLVLAELVKPIDPSAAEPGTAGSPGTPGSPKESPGKLPEEKSAAESPGELPAGEFPGVPGGLPGGLPGGRYRLLVRGK